MFVIQANEPVDVSVELHSLRQELKNLHKEVDTLAQGTDHPEVKRFAGGHHLIVCCSSVPLCWYGPVDLILLKTALHVDMTPCCPLLA